MSVGEILADILIEAVAHEQLHEHGMGRACELLHDPHAVVHLVALGTLAVAVPITMTITVVCERRSGEGCCQDGGRKRTDEELAHVPPPPRDSPLQEIRH